MTFPIAIGSSNTYSLQTSPALQGSDVEEAVQKRPVADLLLPANDRAMKIKRLDLDSSPLLKLPTDLLNVIFRFLSKDPSLIALRSTCRRFYDIVNTQARAKELVLPSNDKVAKQCAYLGYLNLLQWALDKGYPLEVLQWAHANGCPWDEQTCENAAEGGHLQVLQ